MRLRRGWTAIEGQGTTYIIRKSAVISVFKEDPDALPVTIWLKGNLSFTTTLPLWEVLKKVT